MKNRITILALLTAFLGYHSAFKAQLSGVYNVPSTYSSIGAAISALNTNGVNGAVTVAISAGYTETAVSGGYTLNSIFGASATNSVVFQKTGAGANPRIIAYTGGTCTPATARQDGVWRFNGTDYVTIDGIDIQDNNTTNPASMEFGYGFFKASATDGCQFNSIINSTITLNRVNNALGSGPAADGSRGIDVVNALLNAHTTAVVVTNSLGTNSNNRFYNNTIQNCNYGLSLIGFADISPYSFSDFGNDIGGSSPATGNNIINFGGGGVVSPAAGIRTLAQYNIIIRFNSINNNTGAGINHATTIRGIYLNTAAGANMAVSNNTVSIKNSGTTTQVSLIETASGGTANNNTITISNNLFSNCTNTANTTGVFYGVWNSNPCANLIITNNTFTNNTSNATSGATYLIYNNATAIPGLIDISNNILSHTFNNLTTAYSGVFYNIFSTGAPTTSTLNISANAFTAYTFAPMMSSSTIYFLYGTGTPAVATFSNNIWQNLTLNHSGSEYFLYDGTSVQLAKSITGNSITNLTKLGSATTMFGFLSAASSLAGSTHTITGNVISNVTATVSGAGTAYFLYNSDGQSPYPTKSISNNTVTNIVFNNSSTSYGAFINNLGSGTLNISAQVNNNRIDNISTLGTLYGLFFSTSSSTSTPLNVHSNTISNLFSGGASSSIYGAQVAAAGSSGINFYQNRILNIVSTGSLSPNAYGLFTSTSPTTNIYNNVIGGITATAATTNSNPVWGIYVNSGSIINLHHNSVFLNATSSSPLFGSTALYANITPSLFAQNNIFVNNSVATGTGVTAAFRRSSNLVGTYNALSNNNLFYAGVPSASNIIYSDFTSSYATLATYKAGITGGRDVASVTENPPFASTVITASNYLNINTSTPTQVESGGIAVPTVTSDIVGTARNASSPDIGAWEGSYTILDVSAPSASAGSFMPLPCSSSSANYSVNLVDPSGVGSGSLAPKLYYKRNAGSYSVSAGSLAAGTSSNGVWTFSLSYPAGVTGDIISYYLVVQDARATPNLGAFPALGFSGTNVNNVTTPPTQPEVFIIAGSMAGTYSVGASQTFTTLTNAVYAYNNACLTGAVTFVLTDAVYSASETFPIVIRSNTTASSSNSLLIKPASSISPTITGVISNNAIIKLNGADYVTIDGSNNGTLTKDLKVENTNTVGISSVIWIGNANLFDAASDITIKNSLISGNSASFTTAGILVGSGITLGGASEISNNNLNFSGNIFIRSQQAIFANGNAVTPDMNWKFLSNFCGSTNIADKLFTRGILIQNATSVTVNSNTISGLTTTLAAQQGVGILIGGASTNFTVNGNVIKDLVNTNTVSASGYNGVLLSSTSTSANILISNNFISDIRTYGSTGAGITANGYGISISSGAGYKVYHNTVWLNTSPLLVTSIPAPLFITSGVTLPGAIDLRNNIFANTHTITQRYTIYSQQASNLIFSNIDYNDYSSTGPNLGFISFARTNLAAIQSGFGGNLNATTVTPVFTSSVDLHLIPASNGPIDDLGTSVITFVPSDIDGASRSTTLPDLGADEFTGPGCVSVNGGTATIASYTGCAGASFTLANSGASSGSGIIRQWQVGSSAGGPYSNVVAGSGFLNTTLNTGPLTAGTLYYILTTTCTSAALTASSNEVTVSVLPVPSASASLPAASICPGQNINFLGATNTGTAFNWSGPNGFVSSVQSPTITAAVPGANGTYSFFTSNLGCNSPTVIVHANMLGTVNISTPATISAASICIGSTPQLSVGASPSARYNMFYSAGTNLISTVGGNTVLTSGNDDTPMTAPAAIGFSFNFDGVNYTQFSASPDGWIMLGGVPATADWSNNVVSPTNTPKIYPYWDDLATGTTGNVRTLLIGTAPNRTLVVEWFVTIPRNTVGPANSSFQLLLYEGTNAVEFRYGTMNNSIMSVSSGLTANASNYASVTFANNSVSNLIANNANSGQPANGSSYYFTPAVVNYNWSPSFSLSSPSLSSVTSSATSSTIYSLTMNNNGSCPSTTSTLSLNVATIPTLSIVQTSTLLCDGASATITASGASTYTWSNNSNGNTLVVTPTTNTVYSVIGTNPQCPTSTATTAISSGITPTVLISGLTTICSGDNFTLSASGAATYSWNTAATTATIAANPTTSVTYTVTGFDGPGCSNTLTYALTVNPLPVLAISGSASICVGQSATLNVSGANTYTWNTGATTNNISTSPSLTASYTVSGTNLLGCVSSTTQLLSVQPLPTVSISGSSSVCIGSSLSLTASGASTYLWSGGSSNALFTSAPSTSTNYVVVGSSAVGCTNTAIRNITVASVPTINIISSNSVCASNTIGITATGAISYSWNTGAGGASIVANPSVNTTYSVIGTDAQGCSSSTNKVINAIINPTLNISGTASICAGQTLNLSASGANTYTWSTGSNAVSISTTPSATASYTVMGTNGLGCTASAVKLATVNALPNLTVAGTSSICAGQTVNLSVAGASTYTWNIGSNANTIATTPTTSTVYTVTATDVIGCVNVGTRSVTVAPKPNVNISGSTGICTGQTATLIANGASTYTWNGGSTSSTITSTPSVTTNYTLSGTDLLGCTNSTTQLVSVAASLTITIAGPSSICIGQTANLTGNGGVTYTWNTSATSQTIAPSPTVTTTYSIIGASGTCSNTGSAMITVNPNPTVSISGVGSLCVNQTSVLTGSGANTYSWSTGAISPTAAITQTANTIYTVTGINAFGCANVQTLSVVSLSVPVITVAQSANSVCVNSPGTFTASGASTYTWSSVSNNTIVNISPTAAANYTVNGTNALGCISSKTFALGTFSLPILSATPSAATVCAFSPATFNASGANTYTWNTSVISQTASFSPSVATIYTLSGANADGCVSTITLGVATNSLPALVITPSSATVCVFSSASFAASGASTYTWNGSVNSSTASFSPSVASVYTLSGTNPAGCISTTTVGVITNTLPIINVAQSANTICVNSPATFTASGANTYTWSTVSNNTTISIIPAVAANYTVNGTNGFGCVSSRTFALGTFTLPVLSIVPASATVCSLSQALFNASGATTYTWNSTVFTQTASFTPTTSSVYTLSGTNPSGCVSTVTVGVTTNTLPVLAITPPSATVCSASSVSFTANGANSYTWSGAVTTATASFSPSITTVYTITGVNPAGCTSTNSITVSTNTLPIVTISPASATVCPLNTSTYSPIGASTYTWLNASTNILVSASGGGAAITPTSSAVYTVSGTNGFGCVSSTTLDVGVYALPVLIITPASPTVCSLSQVIYTASGANTYSWSGSITTATAAFIPTVSTVYSLTGVSINSCVSTTTVGVITNTLPIVSINSSTNTTCVSSPVSYTANGASTYVWSNNSIGSTVTVYPISNSIYTVTGINSLGCSATSTVAIATNSLPIVSVSPSLTTICALSNTTLTASGALSYSWSSGSIGTSAVVNPSISSSYLIIGTDALGCSNIASAVVLTNTLPLIAITASSPTTCANAAVSFTANGGNTYTWSTGSTGTTVSVTPSITSTYSVIGSDLSNGCLNSSTIAVTTLSLPIVTIAASAASVCPDGSATFTASGALTYSWDSGSTAQSVTITPIAASVYTVIGKDAFGCMSSQSVALGLFTLPTMSLSPANQSICVTEVASFTVSGASTYTWLPSNSNNTTFTASPTSVTFYTVAGTDANNCSNQVAFSVNVSNCNGLTENLQTESIIRVFPNPSRGVVTAEFNFEGTKDITVVNGIGQLILGIKTERYQETFDLSSHAKGLYYIKIRSINTSSNYRIVIE